MKICIVVGLLGAVPKDLEKSLEELKNRKNRDHPDHSIFKISQNTGKSPGDLRRLVVTQTPVKDHQLVLVWKARKVWNNNSNILIKIQIHLEVVHFFFKFWAQYSHFKII